MPTNPRASSGPLSGSCQSSLTWATRSARTRQRMAPSCSGRSRGSMSSASASPGGCRATSSAPAATTSSRSGTTPARRSSSRTTTTWATGWSGSSALPSRYCPPWSGSTSLCRQSATIRTSSRALPASSTLARPRPPVGRRRRSLGLPAAPAAAKEETAEAIAAVRAAVCWCRRRSGGQTRGTTAASRARAACRKRWTLWPTCSRPFPRALRTCSTRCAAICQSRWWGSSSGGPARTSSTSSRPPTRRSTLTTRTRGRLRRLSGP
mmetsp:Transcript_91012/g.241722  ORF Transcript_91012/g.241722 Transcript_91012/m.241722 type:complete len:265 (-) Transcript_91012:245-1039(-)